MFDVFAFYDLVRRKGKTIKEVAVAMGVSTPTLYRKMSGKSDFRLSEIKSICDYLGETNLSYIFFAPEVS